jgi:isoquinoline 1-oxidoreductase beta subunit
LGRALEPDAIPIAVALARQAGKPVQLVIPHGESSNHDKVRPPMVARMAAMPAPDGTLAGWSAKFATAAGLGAALSRLSGKDAPAVDLPGAAPPYAIPSLRIDAVTAQLPIACGYMRGGSEALTAFATESFIDEMARRMDREPSAFRMAMLSGNPRLASVLNRVIAAAGWDGGQKMGIACGSAYGSHIALVTWAGIANDRITVDRLVAAVDCGQVVNPSLLRQQVEASILQALALATMVAPRFVAAMPVARSLRNAGAIPALQVPEIAIEIINSDNPSGGVSGLGHMVLAPSLANALAAATGRRLRNLPFDLNGA